MEYLTQRKVKLSLAQVMQNVLEVKRMKKGEPSTSLHMNTSIACKIGLYYVRYIFLTVKENQMKL